MIYINRPGQAGHLAVGLSGDPAATAENPGFFFYGTEAGQDVRMNFREGDGKYLGHDEIGTGGAFTEEWEAFKLWLSSESGAEDVPWWLDFLCSLACGSVLPPFTNPVSISACVHCLGLYVSACIPANPT